MAIPLNMVHFLASHEIFGNLDKTTLNDLLSEVEYLMIPGRNEVMRQGEKGDCMYIVIHGRLHVTYVQENGEVLDIGEIGQGECVGEMSLLTGEDRAATVHTIRDTEVLRFSKEGFDRLLAKSPVTMMKIARNLVSRLKRAIQPSNMIHTLKSISIFPASKEVPLSEFSKNLEKELSSYGPILSLSSKNWREIFGNGTSQLNSKNSEHEFDEIGKRFNDIESNYKFIIFESDPDWSTWAKFCARQADRILLVGLSNAEPVAGELVNRLFINKKGQITPRKSLVLLSQNSNQRLQGTQKWLSKMHLNTRHHICLDSKADYQRLSRLLTGNAVGLVLGGGGARGFAHIGAIRAFQENGINIDYIGATSMGTVIGSQLAMGWNWKRMVEENRRIFIESGSLYDFTIPVVSLLKGLKFDRAFRPIYHDLQIEDLHYNFFCVSFNLTRSEPVIHQTGHLMTAVKASCAVPGIFPPVLRDHELLVDGGIYNNFPIDIISNYFEGKIIGVDVSPATDLRAPTNSWSGIPSPMSILLDMLNPFKKANAFPKITDILLHVINARDKRMANEQRKNIFLYLNPPLDQLGQSEWKELDKFVDIGYHYTKEKLAERLKSGDESAIKGPQK